MSREGKKLLCWIINKSCLHHRVCTYLGYQPQLRVVFCFLQRPQCPSLVKDTQELPASRGRSRSFTYPRKREARSGFTSIFHNLQYFYHQISDSVVSVVLFLHIGSVSVSIVNTVSWCFQVILMKCWSSNYLLKKLCFHYHGKLPQL